VAITKPSQTAKIRYLSYKGDGVNDKHLSIVGFGINRATADFYPTPNYATQELLKRETFEGTIWEPASGNGAIAKFFPNCMASDIRTDEDVYGEKGINFFLEDRRVDNIITNPPYKYAQKFVEHSLACANKKVAMLLKLVFLESQSRKRLFENNRLRKVYVFRKRLKIYAYGKMGKNSGLIAYAWFIWDKNYTGLPTIDWI